MRSVFSRLKGYICAFQPGWTNGRRWRREVWRKQRRQTTCRRQGSYQNNWLIARWGERAVVRDDESVTGRMTQLWSRQGTHQVRVHAILNLEDPVDEIVLFTLEVASVLGVLDGTQDTKHACSCPAITWAGGKSVMRIKRIDDGEG